MNDENWVRDLLIERLQADSKALGRIKAATQAAGWPVGETLDDLVAAVAAVSAGRDALAADHARMSAERDALAADNARLLAELVDRADGDGERVAERERLESRADMWQHMYWSLASEMWLALHPGAKVVGSTVDVAQLLAAVRTAGGRHDALPDAPATGGDCGGEQ